MRVEDNVSDWISELNMKQYWNGLYILMAAAVVIILISICGCLGAVAGNSLLLGVVSLLHPMLNFQNKFSQAKHYSTPKL